MKFITKLAIVIILVIFSASYASNDPNQNLVEWGAHFEIYEDGTHCYNVKAISEEFDLPLDKLETLESGIAEWIFLPENIQSILDNMSLDEKELHLYENYCKGYDPFYLNLRENPNVLAQLKKRSYCNIDVIDLKNEFRFRCSTRTAIYIGIEE